MTDLNSEVKALLIKVIVPAVIAVGIKIAVQMKVDKVSILSAITSLVIGVGFAFISHEVIQKVFSNGWQTIMIAVVAIVGEKIGYWMVYKFKFDKFGEAIMESIIKTIKK